MYGYGSLREMRMRLLSLHLGLGRRLGRRKRRRIDTDRTNRANGRILQSVVYR